MGSSPIQVAIFLLAQIAQLVEQRTENPRVGGSIPSLATNYNICNIIIFFAYYILRFKKGRLKFFILSVLGADYEARTRYLHLGKVALYQMS